MEGVADMKNIGWGWRAGLFFGLIMAWIFIVLTMISLLKAYGVLS